MRVKHMFQKMADPQPKLWLIALFALVAGLLVVGKGLEMELRSRVTSTVPMPSVLIETPKPPELLNIPPQQIEQKIGGTILFAGDMQWDRYIRQMATKQGYDFIIESVTPVLQKADVVVANLEGPVTAFPSKSLTAPIGSHDNYIFTFSPEILPVLKENNITVVNLGNNHILNFGVEGLAQTERHLQEHGIEYFGNTGKDTWLEDSFLEYELNGLPLLLVNYNQFLETDFDALLEEIKQRDQQYKAIVLYTHWGNEYVLEASPLYQDWAHTFVDAGVDLIIGSHPHVIQQKEVYMSKTIYYSLGNFIFDQYFDTDPRKGWLVEVAFDADGNYSTTEIPTYLEKTGQTVLAE